MNFRRLIFTFLTLTFEVIFLVIIFCCAYAIVKISQTDSSHVMASHLAIFLMTFCGLTLLTLYVDELIETSENLIRVIISFGVNLMATLSIGTCLAISFLNKNTISQFIVNEIENLLRLESTIPIFKTLLRGFEKFLNCCREMTLVRSLI